MVKQQDIKMNPFTVVCEHASCSHWCWKIHCSTCGHGKFRIAFSKIANNQDPENSLFWSFDNISSVQTIEDKKRMIIFLRLPIKKCK